MQDLLAHTNSIKLRLMRQFYGIEEFLDLETPVPAMLDALDNAESEFAFITVLSDLDLWYIKVTNSDNENIWNPFVEPLSQYAKRYELLIAHLYPEKQWPNSEVLAYSNQQKP